MVLDSYPQPFAFSPQFRWDYAQGQYFPFGGEIFAPQNVYGQLLRLDDASRVHRGATVNLFLVAAPS